MQQIGSMRGLATNAKDNGSHQASNQALAPMKQRAYSSTGRTQGHFNQLHEMTEVEAIQEGLQSF